MTDDTTDPPTLAEHDNALIEHTDIAGTGLDTELRIPCPYCTARGFLTIKVLDLRIPTTIAGPILCNNCQRSSSGFLHPDHDNITAIRFTLAIGPPIPDYIDGDVIINLPN